MRAVNTAADNASQNQSTNRLAHVTNSMFPEKHWKVPMAIITCDLQL